MRRLAVLSALLLSVSPARAAAKCPLPEGAEPALSGPSDEARQAAVEDALARAGAAASQWAWAWRTSFLTTGSFQVGLIPAARNDADRIDLKLGGGKSIVAFAFAIVTQLPAEKHHDTFEPPPPEPRSCARLAELEQRLRTDAMGERRGKHWVMHALSIGFNVGVGALAYYLHGRAGSAILGAVSGSVVGELRIYTQPMTADTAWAAYLRGAVTAPAVVASPFLTPVPDGAVAGLALRF